MDFIKWQILENMDDNNTEDNEQNQNYHARPSAPPDNFWSFARTLITVTILSMGYLILAEIIEGVFCGPQRITNYNHNHKHQAIKW